VTSRQLFRVAAFAACVLLPVTSFAQVRPSLPPDSPFGGGVPQGTVTSDTLKLSVLDVIKRALEHNLGALLAAEDATDAAGSRKVALSDLMPHVSGRVSQERRKTNLEAFGFPLQDTFPKVVGPFNVFDARVFLSQTVLDMSALNDFRASEHSLTAAKHSARSARDLVVLVAANLYLQTLATEARTVTARAQLDTATSLHQQALNLRQSGLVAGIDVVRAEVRMITERQRVTAAANDFEKSKLQLARVIGLPPGQMFELSQEIPFVPVPEMTLEEALARAYRERPDYLAAQERVQEAESARKAIVGEGLPSLRVTADYGAIGLQISSSLPTFSVVGALSVPIFEGGETRARVQRADTELKTREAELADITGSVRYDVEGALLDIKAADAGVGVADGARTLARQELDQAQDRFKAGVASTLELVQAQEAVASASEQYIASVYAHAIAKGELAKAIGQVEQRFVALVGGAQ